MHIQKCLEGGALVKIVVRRKTVFRLFKTCFRGKSHSLAGNFKLWETSRDFFEDGVVLQNFLTELDEAWEGKWFGTNSVTIPYPHVVGWESTAPRANYPEDSLEEFDLNRHAWGLRVKLDRKDIFAPQTRELTIVYEFKMEDGLPVAIIHSIYPGVDIGELHDDVTVREQRIFFDWSHPGFVEN